MKKTLIAAALLAATTTTQAATLEAKDETTTYLARWGELAGIAWEMQVAGVDLCGDNARYLPGFKRLEKGNDVESDGYELFGKPTIIAVFPGSPAESAGLKPGDHLVAINGEEIPENGRFVRKDRQEVFIDEALEKAKDSAEPLALTVEREGETLDLSITPVKACDVGVVYMPRVFPTIREPGYAIIGPLVDQLPEDWQVKAFIAPELAVSMSENRQRKKTVEKVGGLLEGAITMATGTDVLGITSIGAAAWYSKPTALEADKDALYLLARVGVDVTQVPGMWTTVYNFPREGSARTFFGLRPSLEDRLAAMNETIPLILEKQEKGEPLTPAKS